LPPGEPVSEEQRYHQICFLYPLSDIHPQARAKSLYILAAKDKVAAYEEVMAGKFDKELPGVGAVNPNAEALLGIHGEAARKMRIPATPAFWIDEQQINDAEFKKMDAILKQREKNR